MKMNIDLKEACNYVVSSIKTKGTEVAPLASLYHRVSASRIAARENMPPFNNSAMDGYVVHHEDIKTANKNNPVILDIDREIHAGDYSQDNLPLGKASKIMTGAIIPPGSDTVVMKEYTEQLDGKIKIFYSPSFHENIRFMGEDVKQGDIFIQKGDRLTPAKIGMLAAQGITSAEVFMKPTVAVLTSGNEILEPGNKISPAMIRNSNSIILMGLITGCDAVAVDFGIARDTIEDLETKVRSCLSLDMVIITGGVSMGDRDYVLRVLEKIGVKIIFWKIKIKPGKPMVYGIFDGKPVFGLPGNPVSAMVTFELLVRPALLKMQGMENIFRVPVKTIMEDEYVSKTRRTEFVCAITCYEDNQFKSKLTGAQGSGILSSMVHANSLVMVPSDKSIVKKGDRLISILLDIPSASNNMAWVER